MRNQGWKSALLGAAAFIVAHAIEMTARIGGDQPWFISTLPSALFTIGLMLTAGVIVGATHRGGFVALYLSALSLVAGAAVPMTITLFTHPQGPGNLFPLALMLGIAALGLGSFAGTAVGWVLRRVVH